MLFLVFFCLLQIFLAASTSDGETNSEQSGFKHESKSMVEVASINLQLRVLFKNCFNKINPVKNDLFIIKGRDGDNYISISFAVEGDTPGCCLLKYHLERNAQMDISLTGSLVAVDHDMENVPVDIPNYFNSISFRICATAEPFWELKGFFPNGQVSGKFIRAFVVQGIAATDVILRYASPISLPPTQLKLTDHSSIREQFWMEKNTGLTYYESWGLEYNCLLAISQQALLEYHQFSASVYNLPAEPAFNNMNFDPMYNPSDLSEDKEIYYFTEEFIKEIEAYVTSLGERKQSIKIRQALDEFLARIRALQVDPETLWILSQNTFIFFFRNIKNFDWLARQVLVSYDPDCQEMRGIPTPPSSFHEFEYAYYYGVRQEEVDFEDLLSKKNLRDGSEQISSSSASPPSSTAHQISSTGFRSSRVYHLFFLFSLCFLLSFCITTFDLNVSTDHNDYLEL